MLKRLNDLVKLDPTAAEQSQKVVEKVRAEIKAAGGFITFAKYMETVLYSPGLGYYSAGAYKIGQSGDFVTAPEISPLFSQCLARQSKEVLSHLGKGSILEIGAGSGVMAAEILKELEKQNSLPIHYYILEISADLKERQKDFLKKSVPHLFSHIIWLDDFPTEFSGIILANEVLDAMPVNRFCIQDNKLFEYCVKEENDQFVSSFEEICDPLLKQKVENIREKFLPDVKYYESEINLRMNGWIKKLSECLKRGLILLIDYGFPAHEFYHLDRKFGTLMCHYQHHSNTDPFWSPGLQDMTSHVDFTAVAESAHDNGLTVSGYTQQAPFLLACGLLETTKGMAELDIRHRLSLSQQIQKLTGPHEMGELFKVIALTRDLEGLPLMGFIMKDDRGRL